MGKNSKIEWTHHTRLRKTLWGPKAPRRFLSDAYWMEPKKWNREAKQQGHRARVFCASMADVFEARSDLNGSRERLWKLIEETPQLDWLLLTKRPERILKTVPWLANWPKNVWIGTTVEDQESAEQRLPHYRQTKRLEHEQQSLSGRRRRGHRG